MNAVARKLVLAFSVHNRRVKLAAIVTFMTAHDVRTIVLVGVAGESNEPNEDLIEHALAERADVIAAVSHVAVTTSLPLVIADGRQLPFQDHSVDLVLSNAVIEHVGDEAMQHRFVDEHLRVGRAWCITTPNRWFPVESHTSVVLKHWSASWRARHNEFTRLLSLREFRALLPADATIRGRPWSATFMARGISTACLGDLDREPTSARHASRGLSTWRTWPRKGA